MNQLIWLILISALNLIQGCPPVVHKINDAISILDLLRKWSRDDILEPFFPTYNYTSQKQEGNLTQSNSTYPELQQNRKYIIRENTNKTAERRERALRLLGLKTEVTNKTTPPKKHKLYKREITEAEIEVDFSDYDQASDSAQSLLKRLISSLFHSEKRTSTPRHVPEMDDDDLQRTLHILPFLADMSYIDRKAHNKKYEYTTDNNNNEEDEFPSSIRSTEKITSDNGGQKDPNFLDNYQNQDYIDKIREEIDSTFWTSKNYSHIELHMRIHELAVKPLPPAMHKEYDEWTDWLLHTNISEDDTVTPAPLLEYDDYTTEQISSFEDIMRNIHDKTIINLPHQDHMHWDTTNRWRFHESNRIYYHNKRKQQDILNILNKDPLPRIKRETDENSTEENNTLSEDDYTLVDINNTNLFQQSTQHNDNNSQQTAAINLDDILEDIDLTPPDTTESRYPLVRVDTNFNKKIYHREELQWQETNLEPGYRDIFEQDDSAHDILWSTQIYSDYRKFKTLHDFGIQHMPPPLHLVWDQENNFKYHWEHPDGPLTTEDIAQKQRLTLQGLLEELHDTAVVYLPDIEHTHWDRKTNWTFHNDTRKRTFLKGLAKEIHRILSTTPTPRTKRTTEDLYPIQDWVLDSIFGKGSDTGMLTKNNKQEQTPMQPAALDDSDPRKPRTYEEGHRYHEKNVKKLHPTKHLKWDLMNGFKYHRDVYAGWLKYQDMEEKYRETYTPEDIDIVNDNLPKNNFIADKSYHAIKQIVHDTVVSYWPDENHELWDMISNGQYHDEYTRYPINDAMAKQIWNEMATVTSFITINGTVALTEQKQQYNQDKIAEITSPLALQRQKREIDEVPDLEPTAPATLDTIRLMGSTLPIGQAYITKEYHYFRKTIPFSELFEEILSLQYNLKNLDPMEQQSKFQLLQGHTTLRKFYKKKQPESFTRNSLACSEIGGDVADWKTITEERIAISNRISTSDHLRVRKSTTTCTIYGQERSQYACLEIVKQIALESGIFFTNKTTTDLHNWILDNYPETTLYIILDGNRVNLEANPIAQSICTVPIENSTQTPDMFTTIVQNKFWDHLALSYSQTLDLMYRDAINLQHMYALSIDSKLSGDGMEKNTSDICKAIRTMMPKYTPASTNRKETEFQDFLNNYNTNTHYTTRAFERLQKSTNELCKDNDNKILLISVSQALTIMNSNIQTHVASIHKHLQSTTEIMTPRTYAILHNENTTAADIESYYNYLTASSLTDKQLILLFTIIENEKINTVNFLASYIPQTPLPSPMQFSDQYKYAQKKKPKPKGYATSTETIRRRLGSTTPKPNRLPVTTTSPPAIQDIEIGDQPNQDRNNNNPNIMTHEDLRSLLDGFTPPEPTKTNKLNTQHTSNGDDSDTTTHEDLRSLLSSFTPAQTPRVTPTKHPLRQKRQAQRIKETYPLTSNQREKRETFWELVANYAGLATKQNIDLLTTNEHILADNEKLMEKQIETIMTKTNSIVTSFQEQAAKLSELYHSESNVKEALKNLLKDEKDTLVKINQLIMSLEVFSDVTVEFGSIDSMLSLLPHFLHEVESAVDSVLAQGIHPTLLPVDSIKEKIPIQTKVSMLTPSVKTFMTAAESYIEYRIPEYYPAFNIFQVKALPIKHSRIKNAVYELDLTKEFVAINNLQETFIFDSNLCPPIRGYHICPAHAIEIHTAPKYCAEVFVKPTEENAVICAKTFKATSRPSHQRYIHVKEMTKARIYSPFPDTASTLCGTNFTKDAYQLGSYTDISTDCIIYTSQLKIVPPLPKEDTTNVTMQFLIPDMSTVVDALMDDLEVLFKENMTALLQDYSTLKENMESESKTIIEVQQALNQAKTLGKIEDFDILHIDMKNLNEPTEAAKIAFWGVSAGALVAALCLLWCCCPACATEAIKYAVILVWNTLTFFLTRIRNAITKTCRTNRARTPPPPDDDSIEAVLWSNDCVDIQFRGPLPNSPQQPLLSTINEQAQKLTRNQYTPGAPEIEMSDLPRNSEYMSSTNIYPTLDKSTPLPSPLADTKNWPWSIINSGNRLMIRCYRDDVPITYLPHLSMSYNDLGQMMVIQAPKLNIIQEYMAHYIKQQTITLNEFQKQHGTHWLYNNHLKSFYTIFGDKQIHKYGFKMNPNLPVAV